MKTLLALDPSIRSAGVAIFHMGILTGVTTITDSGDKKDPVERKLERMAGGILAWLQKTKNQPTAIIGEWPQVYREGIGTNDRNQLLPLAGLCGYLAGCLAVGASITGGSCPLTLVTPKEWTGQIPKLEAKSRMFISARARRIEARLDEWELGIYKKAPSHDAIDAVGIGLHALDRGIMKPHRKFYGAT